MRLPSKLFLAWFVAVATPATAQDAIALLDRMDRSERNWIVTSPEPWLGQQLIRFNSCRGEEPVLTVEAAEARRSAQVEQQVKKVMGGYLKTIAEFDTNGDGEITGAEATVDDRRLRRVISNLDRNGDRFIQTPEIERSVRIKVTKETLILDRCHRLFASDINRDGVLEAHEFETVAEIIKTAVFSPPGPADRCVLPQFDRFTHSLDAFGARRGVVAAGGRPEIELKGTNGHYPRVIVVFSEEPVVWRYTGAPDRVAQLVVAGEAIDVLGLPPEKVTRIARSECTTYRPVVERGVERMMLAAQIGAATDMGTSHFQMLEQPDAFPNFK